jgi:SH3-like domain-containing protein
MDGARMRGWKWAALAAVALGLALPAWAQRKPPYYASIDASVARMRTGPGRNYPASWLYKRRDLPVKVVGVYGEWRKIEDPGGTQGWMLRNLLKDGRTAMVMGTIAEMRVNASPAARISWRAAPGVIGRISRCADGWCRFDVNGRAGYVEQARLWGVDPGEVVD